MNAHATALIADDEPLLLAAEDEFEVGIEVAAAGNETAGAAVVTGMQVDGTVPGVEYDVHDDLEDVSKCARRVDAA